MLAYLLLQALRWLLAMQSLYDDCDSERAAWIDDCDAPIGICGARERYLSLRHAYFPTPAVFRAVEDDDLCWRTAFSALRCAMWYVHRPFRLALLCKSVRDALLAEDNESNARESFEREFPCHVRWAPLYDMADGWRERYHSYCYTVACCARVMRLDRHQREPCELDFAVHGVVCKELPVVVHAACSGKALLAEVRLLNLFIVTSVQFHAASPTWSNVTRVATQAFADDNDIVLAAVFDLRVRFFPEPLALQECLENAALHNNPATLRLLLQDRFARCISLSELRLGRKVLHDSHDAVLRILIAGVESNPQRRQELLLSLERLRNARMLVDNFFDFRAPTPTLSRLLHVAECFDPLRTVARDRKRTRR
ncbi:Hypothetical protein UVM_LOCUS291 [uncultured virus]|nr:Hypothetical protein UVM_LOCUS291 [uncultured virus]